MSSKFLIEQKSILFSKLNPRIKRLWAIGSTCKDSICSTEFIVYRAIKEVNFPFAWCYLNSRDYYDQVMSEVNGATGSHQRFHADNTLNYLIPYNETVIASFSAIISPILQTILRNEDENRILKNERDTLLPNLMAKKVSLSI